jgi:hypothetical protein
MHINETSTPEHILEHVWAKRSYHTPTYNLTHGFIIILGVSHKENMPYKKKAISVFLDSYKNDRYKKLKMLYYTS